MITLIDFDEAMKLPSPFFVDVRSESEYVEDHIPQAVNIPVFNNGERAMVGTVYKDEGPEAARKLGLEIVSPKLPGIVQAITEAALQRPIVLYCWRGGLRSHSLAAILDLMNLHVYRLIGGYKRFRRWINAYFGQTSLPFKLVVLHGLTGTGKTHVINQLKECGAGVIDLEDLANNRGSVFGNVGLPDQPSQKKFESALWFELKKNERHRYVIVECESRRIGKLTLPLLLSNNMKEGRHILLYDTLPNRVYRIIHEYDACLNKDELIKALHRLKDRIGNEKIFTLGKLIEAGNYYPVVEELLVNYYDPLYRYPDQPSDCFDLSVRTADAEQAVKEILRFISTETG